MANVIIGIHGLGNKPKKTTLESWWKLAMIEGLKASNFSSTLPKFEMVYWADILHKEPLNKREKNTESPAYMDEPYVKASKNFEAEDHSMRMKIVSFLGKQFNKLFLNPDFTLNYTHLTDIIIKRYFYDLEVYYTENCTVENQDICKAKDIIKHRLIDVLIQHKNDKIMLISHSMGSIIAYDVLNFEVPNLPIHTFITMGSPLGLPIVISKIASEQKQSLITPTNITTPDSVKNNWYNFSDILDKVAFNFKLDDDFDENHTGIKPIDFLVVNNYEINQVRNPHKSYGYLRTPEFAGILNEFITSEELTFKEKLIRKKDQVLAAIKMNLLNISNLKKPKLK